jgi:hypothetical protein
LLESNSLMFFQQVQKLKQEAELVSCRLKPKERGHPGQKQEKR